MEHRLREIVQLSELLESEASGKPFDRTRAQQLALTLAEHHPEMGNSMRAIWERLRQGDVRR